MTYETGNLFCEYACRLLV